MDFNLKGATTGRYSCSNLNQSSKPMSIPTGEEVKKLF